MVASSSTRITVPGPDTTEALVDRSGLGLLRSRQGGRLAGPTAAGQPDWLTDQIDTDVDESIGHAPDRDLFRDRAPQADGE